MPRSHQFWKKDDEFIYYQNRRPYNYDRHEINSHNYKRYYEYDEEIRNDDDDDYYYYYDDYHSDDTSSDVVTENKYHRNYYGESEPRRKNRKSRRLERELDNEYRIKRNTHNRTVNEPITERTEKYSSNNKRASQESNQNIEEELSSVLHRSNRDIHSHRCNERNDDNNNNNNTTKHFSKPEYNHDHETRNDYTGNTLWKNKRRKSEERALIQLSDNRAFTKETHQNNYEKILPFRLQTIELQKEYTTLSSNDESISKTKLQPQSSSMSTILPSKLKSYHVALHGLDASIQHSHLTSIIEELTGIRSMQVQKLPTTSLTSLNSEPCFVKPCNEAHTNNFISLQDNYMLNSESEPTEKWVNENQHQYHHHHQHKNQINSCYIPQMLFPLNQQHKYVQSEYAPVILLELPEVETATRVLQLLNGAIINGKVIVATMESCEQQQQEEQQQLKEEEWRQSHNNEAAQ